MVYQCQINSWNWYEDVINDLPPTKYAVEGWHRGFAGLIAKHHAQMSEFVNFIKSEQSLTELLINQANSARKIAAAKEKSYENYDVKIKNIVRDYSRENVVRNLCNIAYILTL